MLSHGLVSSALFLCVGVLYDRHKTRLVRYYGGLVSTMPNFSTIFFFFTLANMSLPGTSSFIGEFLILVGAFQRNGKVRNFPYHYFRECEDFVTFLHFFLYTSGVALSAGELLFLDQNLPPVDEAPPSREILDLDLNAPLPDPEPEVEIVPGDDQHVPPIQEDNPITFHLQNDEQRESLEQMLHSVKERCIMKLRNELIVNKRSRKWGSTKF